MDRTAGFPYESSIYEKTVEDVLSVTENSSSAHQFMTDTSTMTRTDIVGAGRTLGRVLAMGGRRVERYIGQIAYNLGYGPQAIAQGIIARLLQAGMHYFSTDFPNMADQIEAHIGCEKLLQFLRSAILICP